MFSCWSFIILQYLPSSIGPNFTSFPLAPLCCQHVRPHTPSPQKHDYALITTASEGISLNRTMSSQNLFRDHPLLLQQKVHGSIMVKTCFSPQHPLLPLRKLWWVSKHVFHKTCITVSEGTQHNSSITEHVVLNIPNMLGSWASITAAEKVMISLKTCFAKELVNSMIERAMLGRRLKTCLSYASLLP